MAKPDGLLVVPPDRELAFLHPLPVERLWGVGPVTAAKLHDRGIATVGEVAGLGEGPLVAMLGRAAGPPPPRPGPQPRSRARWRSAGAGVDRLAARARPAGRAPPRRSTPSLVGLVDRVTRRMRTAERVGRTVVLRLRFDDFTRATRSHTLPRPTAQTATILATARALLAAARPLIDERGLTLVGIAVANLDDDDAVQLDAAVRPRRRRRPRRRARRRAGAVRHAAVTRAVLLVAATTWRCPSCPTSRRPGEGLTRSPPAAPPPATP